MDSQEDHPFAILVGGPFDGRESHFCYAIEGKPRGRIDFPIGPTLTGAGFRIARYEADGTFDETGRVRLCFESQYEREVP